MYAVHSFILSAGARRSMHCSHTFFSCQTKNERNKTVIGITNDDDLIKFVCKRMHQLWIICWFHCRCRVCDTRNRELVTLTIANAKVSKLEAASEWNKNIVCKYTIWSASVPAAIQQTLSFLVHLVGWGAKCIALPVASGFWRGGMARYWDIDIVALDFNFGKIWCRTNCILMLRKFFLM